MRSDICEQGQTSKPLRVGKNDQHREGSFDGGRWRSPAAGRTRWTAWLHDSTSGLHKSKAGHHSVLRPLVPGTGGG